MRREGRSATGPELAHFPHTPAARDAAIGVCAALRHRAGPDEGSPDVLATLAFSGRACEGPSRPRATSYPATPRREKARLLGARVMPHAVILGAFAIFVIGPGSLNLRASDSGQRVPAAARA
jgi:hypothetical protein